MAKKKVHIEYSVERELTEEIGLILAENPRFNAIKEHLVIAACYLVRMDEDGTSQPGKGQHVVIKKVSPEMQVLMRSKANYVLVVDYHWWTEASTQERRGSIRNLLSRIRLEETENGIKTGLEKWDIQEMFSNLEISGVYNDKTAHLKEVMSKATMQMVDSAAKTAQKINRVVQAAKQDADAEAEDEKPPARKGKAADEAETRRPARKIPADPEPESEPEPED